MNDVYAVSSFVIFLTGYLFFLALRDVCRFVLRFRVVRLSDIEYAKKYVKDLERDIALLRQGIIISQDNSTGQVSFDLPDELVEKKIVPFVKKNEGQLEQWEQVWNIYDWTAHQLGKVCVKRGRQYFWVEEVDILPKDKIIDNPYQERFVKVIDKQPRRARRARREAHA